MAIAVPSIGLWASSVEHGACAMCGIPVVTQMHDALPMCPNCGHRPADGD